MKIVLSGGGTAGHIYPALAVADKLQSLGHEVLFVGTPDGLEAKLVPQSNVAFTSLKASGFNRSKPWTLVTSGVEVATSSVRARSILKKFEADVVVGFGGYVSIPVGVAAAQLNIPLVIHEQNSVAGMTNSYLARHARAICVTYPDTVPSMSARAQEGVDIIVTGNPVRASVLKSTRSTSREELGLSDEDIFVFVFGGSRGARHINEALVAHLGELLSNPKVQIVHATGAGEYQAVVDATSELAAEGVYEPRAYVDNMGTLLAASDLAVCRAGATSIAELTALGIPAILVPYPYATDDHQTKNARAMVNHGAGVLIPDSELDERLANAMHELIEDRGKRILMAQASRELGQRNSVQLLVDSIYSVVDR